MTARGLVGVVVAVLIAAQALAGCTPRPPAPDPVAKEFLEAVSSQNWDEARSLVDAPDKAIDAYSRTFAGLQAEGLEIGDIDVETDGVSAIATYPMTWKLPKDRELSYTNSIVLTHQDDQWIVRWLPNSVHPSLGANQHLELRAIRPTRASVVSSDGVPLLEPGTVHRVLVDLSKNPNQKFLVDRLVRATKAAHVVDESVEVREPKGLSIDLSKVQGMYSFAVFPDSVAQVLHRELDGIPGVTINDEAAMVTPHADFAPEIMTRLRSLVDDELEGAAGWRVAAVNNEGVSLSDVDYHEAKPAPRVDVSIDYRIQEAAQKAVDTRPDNETMMVAIRPSTGQILAIAQTRKADKRGDLALTGQFPPGSGFKIITAAAAMQDEGVGPGSPVPCPGRMNIFGRTVVNYNEFALGTVPLEQAFARSCNTSFAQLSTDLKEGRLHDVAQQFGLGSDFSIAGMDTLTGSVPQGKEALERTEAGYGQGLDLASPFGMALVAASAARGSVPTPQLVASKPTEVKDVGPALDDSVVKGLHQMMRSVVTTGTARALKAEGEVYGKTGEAEFDGGSHAWFVGFRPQDPDGAADSDIAFATLVVEGGGSEAAVDVTDVFFGQYDSV